MKCLIVFFAALLAVCSARAESIESTTAAGNAGQPNAVAETSKEANSERPLYTRQDVPGSVQGREVTEVTMDEIKPAFTEETVLELNAIVRRSLKAAGEYSRSVKPVRAAVSASQSAEASAAQREAAAVGLDKLRRLHDRAIAARKDMDAAAEELMSSGESYSEELLAGMVKYVHDVEVSLAKEIASLEVAAVDDNG